MYPNSYNEHRAIFPFSYSLSADKRISDLIQKIIEKWRNTTFDLNNAFWKIARYMLTSAVAPSTVRSDRARHTLTNTTHCSTDKYIRPIHVLPTGGQSQFTCFYLKCLQNRQTTWWNGSQDNHLYETPNSEHCATHVFGANWLDARFHIDHDKKCGSESSWQE